MTEEDKTAREMARIVWEKYGTEIEAIKADTTHLKNVQGQHGIALANVQDQLNRVQEVQGQHGEQLASHGEQLASHGEMLAEQGKMLRAIIRHLEIDVEE